MQSVVVGQQIALSGSQTLPNCMALQSQQWTQPTGTAIGGYTNAAGNGPPDTTGGVVQPLPAANTSSYKFYWVYPGNPLSVNYQTVLATTSGDGYTESSPAGIAEFNVAGPTVSSVTASGQEFFIGDNPPAMNWGIMFNASATPPSGYTGTFKWVQIVDAYSYTWYYPNDPQTTCTYTPGYDAGSPPKYPYATGLSAEDGPDLQLEQPPTQGEDEQSVSGSFQMFFLWNPNVGTTSIDIPLGSISWSIAGDLVWNAVSQSWQKKTGTQNATVSNDFSSSSTFPTWRNAVTTCQ